jgi:hypothetical protein
MNRYSEADDDVARRAYRRYEERGRTDGDDQADWFAAEREREEEARQTTQAGISPDVSPTQPRR